jgi:hypothetical protein
MATYTPVPQFNQAQPKAPIGYAFAAVNLLVTTLAVAITSLPPGKQLSESAPKQIVKTVACEQQRNTLAAGINPNPRATAHSTSAPITKYHIPAGQPLSRPENTLGINPNPRATAHSTSAPITKYAVTVDHPPRPELTLGINPNPSVRQLSDSAPTTPLKAPVVAAQFLNYDALGIPSAAALQIKPVDLSAYQGKYQVVAEQPPRPLTLGINPNPSVKQLSDSSPAIKSQVSALTTPNLNTTTLGTPASPLNLPLLALGDFGGQYKLKYAVVADQYINTLVLGYDTLWPAWNDAESQQQPKAQVQADQYVNLLVLQSIQAPATPVIPYDAGSVKPKYQIYADQPLRPLTLGINPNPLPLQLSASAPITKYAVTIDTTPNVSTQSVVFTIPVGQQLSSSAPPPKYQVQLDQPLQTPLTLGINPNPRAGQQSDSALSALAKWPVVADQFTNYLTLGVTSPPVLALPLGLPVDISQWQGKFQIQNDVYQNILVLGIPNPTVSPIVFGGTGGGGGSRRVPYRAKFGHDAAWLLDRALDNVVAEVMYKDLVQTDAAPKAAKLVKPFAKDRREAIPIQVDWQALERDAGRVGQLLSLWAKLQRQREWDADDEDWFLLGD